MILGVFKGAMRAIYRRVTKGGVCKARERQVGSPLASQSPTPNLPPHDVDVSPVLTSEGLLTIYIHVIILSLNFDDCVSVYST